MQRWEYTWFNESLGNPEDMLKKLGNEGWELVSVVYNGKSMVFYLKRPK
jgi:hypothetical protein